MKNIFLIIFLLYPLKISAFNYNANFYDFKYSKDDLKNIKKVWKYSSGIFKDTQNKLIQYEDRIIHLDGEKNLVVISLKNGEEICKNSGKTDRRYYRGVNLYIQNKDKKEIYAVFPRHNNIKLINIYNCAEKKLEKPIIKKKTLSAPILVHNDFAILLPNGGTPSAYSLKTGELKWRASISKKIKTKLITINKNKIFYWDVWGGGVIDKKFNQVIFSTANAKPSFISKGREGPNLFYNSIVSIDLDNGKYKWHFQEIEHDVLNLDMASPPVLLDKNENFFVVQATKSGQLIFLDRTNGKPIEEYSEKIFYHSSDKKVFTKKKEFSPWLQFSRDNFLKDDINTLNPKYTNKAYSIINDSIISEYKRLSTKKNYIHYGMHGGSEWPGIGVTPDGTVIIPSNNIAWVSKLRDPAEFDFKNETNILFKNAFSVFTFDFKLFKSNVKKTLFQIKKIINYKQLKIEKYKRFVDKDGVPLNSPPWGTITSIDILDKKKNWQIPHGSYPQLGNDYKNTGSEIFGCPVLAGEEIFFMSGTRDKKIYAYNIDDGSLVWEDTLPFVAYSCPIIAKYKKKIYLLISASGGSKFPDVEPGDAIIAYQLL